jgi:hypothetical protein
VAPNAREDNEWCEQFGALGVVEVFEPMYGTT